MNLNVPLSSSFLGLAFQFGAVVSECMIDGAGAGLLPRFPGKAGLDMGRVHDDPKGQVVRGRHSLWRKCRRLPSVLGIDARQGFLECGQEPAQAAVAGLH